MEMLAALITGMLLGMRHATDADHVVTISTIVRFQDGLRGALPVAVLWGLGHTATFFAVGLAIVLFQWQVPPEFESVTELAVAALLVGLGAAHFFRREATLLAVESPRLSVARPFFAGIVHGLAGSAAIGLLALTTIHSVAARLAYLALFGAGTVAGMCALTLTMMVPLRILAGRRQAWLGGLRTLSCAVSIVLGVIMGAHVLMS